MEDAREEMRWIEGEGEVFVRRGIWEVEMGSWISTGWRGAIWL